MLNFLYNIFYDQLPILLLFLCTTILPLGISILFLAWKESIIEERKQKQVIKKKGKVRN